jgi:2-hydroxychromene-2-carboxylate isomerase
MNVNPTPLHFYFDFISPFGYFASLRIEALAARYGRRVEWHAMLLGVSVMKVMGLKPLLDTPLKGDYIRREAERYMRQHLLVLKRKVDDKMMDPRNAGRTFYWIRKHYPELLIASVNALYEAYWVQGLDLSNVEAIAEIISPLGIETSLLIEGIQSSEAGLFLRQGVDESLKLGIFGSPTVLVDGELFWGVQNFELLEQWLETGGW